MNVETIKSLREQYKDAKYLKIAYYSNTVAETISSFVAWNDDAEIATVIRSNNDHYTQTVAPFAIMILDYDKINRIIGCYDEV